jgi:putative transposase
MNKRSSMYKRHRFPPEIIQYVVWLYHRFNLSARDIEDLMAERGIAVSYESIRLWLRMRTLFDSSSDAVAIEDA